MSGKQNKRKRKLDNIVNLVKIIELNTVYIIDDSTKSVKQIAIEDNVPMQYVEPTLKVLQGVKQRLYEYFQKTKLEIRTNLENEAKIIIPDSSIIKGEEDEI